MDADAKAKGQADRERLEKMTMTEIKAVAKDEGICLGYDGSKKRECDWLDS